MRTATTPTLYASSGTIDGLVQMIEKFYGSTKVQIEYDPNKILSGVSVRRMSDGFTMPGVQVRFKNRRYRFEGVK